MTDQIETVAQPAVKWMTTFEHSRLTASERKAESQFVTCCNCKNKATYIDSWVCVPIAANDLPLPLPVFLHCWACSLVLDAQVAYQEAYRRDLEASAPDPVKLARQEQLDKEYAAPEQPEHRHLGE